MGNRVGFVGLGTMGSPMVRRLLESGYDVVVWNRSAGALDDPVRSGAIAARDLAEAFDQPVVMSVLADDASVRERILDSGVLVTSKCHVHINLATISAELAAEATEIHERHGIGYVAAPVLGRADAAGQGALHVLAAGQASAMDKARPILECLAKRFWDLGERPENANLVKIAVNFMIASAIETCAEAVSLVEAYSVDARSFLELVSNSLFPGPVYSHYGGMMVSRQYEPAGFTARLGLKDVRLALSAAHAQNLSLPAASLIQDTLLHALASGWQERDWSTLGEVARARSGRPLNSN